MTDAVIPAPGDTVEVERIVHAPISEVFSAWTEPATMSGWLSPTGHAEVDSDLRTGGSFRVTMVGDGMRIEHTGEYLLVDPPHRLSFTWSSPYTGSAPSRVDVVLTARGATTHVALTHTRLPRDVRAAHEQGWNLMLDRLATLHPDRPAAVRRNAAP
jgi:uncharacterized protein YndB with AHSA1/START domain